MTKDISHMDIESLLDGEHPADEAERLRAEIAADPSLADAYRRMQAVDEIVRASGHETRASDELRKAVEARYGSSDGAAPVQAITSPAGQRRRISRRFMLAGSGGALAAGIAGAMILPGLFGADPANADPVTTFFHDFETYLVKDRALDVHETEMLRLANWYDGRLPFNLPPVGSRSDDVRLIGGRLCWLMERRLASLCFDSASGPMVLYIMDAKGISVPEGREQSDIGKQVSWHRSKGHGCVMWRSDQLLYVMVGTQDVHKLLGIAKALVA